MLKLLLKRKPIHAIHGLQLQNISGEVSLLYIFFAHCLLLFLELAELSVKLKLAIKYLRSILSQGRLHYRMLSIESLLTRTLDFKDLIKDFASREAQRWAPVNQAKYCKMAWLLILMHHDAKSLCLSGYIHTV